MKVNLQINSVHHSFDVPERTTLVELIREHAHLTGTHMGCDTSQCGCCTVLMDGHAIKSCSILALQAQGSHITTIEGLAKPNLEPSLALHPVQKAFSTCHALQCGFCTPGMIMSSVGLLNQNTHPSDEEIIHALEGNLCRCTGYINIVSAVKTAAQIMREESVQ